jgi:two-component system, LuxR family, response regulator FixJ
MSRPTIHVIDDDNAVRDSICLMLESCGFSARPYPSGPAFLRDIPPDRNGCLLVDVNMPGMSGLELLERLRAQGITMAAIVMTGGGITPRILGAADRVGGILLQKPFSPGDLVARIEKILSRYQA